MAIREKRKMYKPKKMNADNIEQGFNKLREDMSRGKKQQVNNINQDKQRQQQLNFPNIWQPKQKPQTPVAKQTMQTNLEEFGMATEDKPYWSAEQWEEWAYELLTTYSDQRYLPKEIMPDWFVQAVEEEVEDE